MSVQVLKLDSLKEIGNIIKKEVGEHAHLKSRKINSYKPLMQEGKHLCIEVPITRSEDCLIQSVNKPTVPIKSRMSYESAESEFVNIDLPMNFEVTMVKEDEVVKCYLYYMTLASDYDYTDEDGNEHTISKGSTKLRAVPIRKDAKGNYPEPVYKSKDFATNEDWQALKRYNRR